MSSVGPQKVDSKLVEKKAELEKRRQAVLERKKLLQPQTPAAAGTPRNEHDDAKLEGEGDMEQEASIVKVGDRCQVGGRRGEVMFVGRVAELPIGLWVGVKYDEPVGKNDGSVKGVRYFECLDKYGGFVRPDTCRSIGDFPECPAATPSAVSQTADPPPPPASKACSLLATPSSRSEPGAAGAATPSSRTRDPSTSIPRPLSTTRSATATTRSATSTFAAGEVEGGGTGVYLIYYYTVPNLLLTQ